MGLFSKLGKKLKKAAKAVVNAVETAVEAVADVVAGVVEDVCNKVEDALDAAADWVDEKVGGGGLVLRWLGDVVAATGRATAAVVKSVAGLVSASFAAAIGIVGFVFTVFVSPRDAAEILIDDLKHGAEEALGAFIHPHAALITLVQTIITITNTRILSPDERDLLHRLYEESIRLDRIRIVDGNAGIFSINDSSFTEGNTIYMKSPRDYLSTLVHESVHVWQYQRLGNGYMGGALSERFIGSNYNWRVHYDQGSPWEDWPEESQAQFVEDLYRYARGPGASCRTTAGRGTFFTPTGAPTGTICNSKDVRLVAEAVHALGVLRTDLRDSVVGAGHKLLFG